MQTGASKKPFLPIRTTHHTHTKWPSDKQPSNKFTHKDNIADVDLEDFVAESVASVHRERELYARRIARHEVTRVVYVIERYGFKKAKHMLFEAAVRDRFRQQQVDSDHMNLAYDLFKECLREALR